MKNNTKMSKKKKIIIISSIIVAILILLVPFVMYLKFILRYSTDEYKNYENKMQIYGFNMLYDNESTKSTQTVTNLEVLKMVLGASLNKNDVTSILDIFSSETEDDMWLEALYENKVINENEVTDDLKSKKSLVKYLLKYIEKCKLYVLNESSSFMSDKNINTMVNTLKDEGIITDYEAKRIDKKLYKGDVNKIICNYVEKYSTVVVGEGNIVTDPNKLPSNAADYPYILDNVDKKVYEQDLGKKAYNEINYANPADVYSAKVEQYSEIKEYIEKYYNTILNIDYKTIDMDNLYNTLLKLSVMFTNGNEDVKEYVDYVKSNEIVLKGKASFVEPCFYLSGLDYKARMKLEFEIVNSKTDKNILFYDLTSDKPITYSKNKYTLYIDANLGLKLNSNYFYNYQNTIYDILLDISKNELQVE